MFSAVDMWALRPQFACAVMSRAITLSLIRSQLKSHAAIAAAIAAGRITLAPLLV